MASARLGLTMPAASAARASSFVGGATMRAAAARPAAGNACRSVVTMAKKGKDVRLMITLECTEQKATGVSGISRYTSEKARRIAAPPPPGTKAGAPMALDRVSGVLAASLASPSARRAALPADRWRARE
jgi:ribosomal protein L33